MVDEIYLCKCAQYSGGDFIRCDTKGNLYKSVIVFMIQRIKKSIPLVIKACPEISLNEHWLAEEMLGYISSLSSIGFSVRAIVIDNHTSNVNAFNILRKMHNSGNPLFFKQQQNTNKTYLFFDNVHIVKNIRNNLLNAKKFVFPAFSFTIGELGSIASQNGYISWDDLKTNYESDAKLAANLRKSSILIFKALYP